MMWGYWGGPVGWAAPFGMMLFWALVLFGVLLLLRSWWTPHRSHDRDDALAILERRYASGEITREEYLAMRRDLTGSGR
jgi:putative membrane protein